MSESPRTTTVRGLIVLLGLLTAAAPLSIDMYLAGLPAIQSEFGVDAAATQRSLSSFFLGLALGQLMLGPLSDRFGRRRMLLVGLGIYLVGTLLCLASPGIGALVGARLVQGFGAAAGPVICRAIIRDVFQGGQAARAMSFVIIVMGAAPLLAPSVGGVIVHWTGWRAIFAVLAGYAALALALVMLRLNETNPPERAGQTRLAGRFGAYLTVIRDRYALSQLAAGGLVFGGLFAYIAGAPFIFMERFGMRPDHFGFILAANVAGMLVGTYLNGRLVRRLGTRRLLNIGLPVCAVSGVSFAATASLFSLPLVAVWLMLFAYVSVIGLVAGNTMANLLERYPENAGAASALFGVAQFTFGASTSAIVGAFGGNGLRGTALVMAAAGLCALAAHLYGLRLARTSAAPVAAER